MKNFVPDNIYSFNELPEQVKQDCLVQLSACQEYLPEECSFKLEIISCQNLLEEMDNLFGPSLTEELESESVLELTEDIKTRGLINFPIGTEGIHRSLAFVNLQKKLPRFKIIFPADC